VTCCEISWQIVVENLRDFTMDLVREGDTGELDLEDPQLEEKLVNELKAQGVFDQFRKDCLSDVDTKPAYQNLRVRVDRSVSSYLSKTTWRPTLNKNQLRNQLRKYIQDMSGVEAGVDRIVDQIVNPKLNTSFMPEVENVIYKYFGTSKPEEGADDMVNGNNIDDENSQLLPNGDSNHDVGGKISTRNLSAISSDAEMLNFDNNSVGSSPGPGLAGNVSPLTPGGSPRVNQGDISPLTPNTTPPPPPSISTDMDVSHAEPAAMLMETPPPPPPGEELKIEDVVSMEVDTVDTEELPRPQSAYTPPLPPANNTNHSTPEKSYTPPLPLLLPPPCPPSGQPSGPPSPHTPPLPPLPKEVGDDSGGEASMSSISDTDLGDISPPRQRKDSGKSSKKDGDTASDISEEELRLGSDVGETSKNRESDSITPDKDTGSDEDLQQLERMKAELMAQLEGDFKLSPEESDSEGEAEGAREATKDSPASPDNSTSNSRSETPAAKQPSPTSTNSSPNQLQRIKALPLPGEIDSDRKRSVSGAEATCDEPAKGHSSPETLISGPRTPPMHMSRTPSQSPSPPPRKGPQTPPSPPSAFSSNSQPYPPSTPPQESQANFPVPPTTPPQESLSKLDLNDPKPVESTCKPFSQGAGPKTPPGPDSDPEGFGGKTAHPQFPQTGTTSSSQDGSTKSTTPTEGSDQKTPANKSSHSHSSSRSHHSSHKHHSNSKDRKSEKKIDKIKEQTKAKIEKYEQKIKSKDKLKSDKFLALDIFSTTKKPSTPYQPHSRGVKQGVTSGSSTPTNSKPPQREFEKKLQESIKKVVQIREEEKEKRRKEEEKKNAFKMPVRIEDRRRSSSGEGIKERRSSKDDKDSTRSKERHERDRKEKKSSADKERRHSVDDKKEKERRHSEDEKKDSKYEKEREKQALESKKRLHEAREKKEKEEKERKRVKDKERRDKDKKIKEEGSRKEKEKKDEDKPKDKSKTENLLKSKIGALGSDNIEKMLVEALAEKTGAKFSEDEKKEMLKKLEGLIKKKKDAKESPKKQKQSDDKSIKKISPKKNTTILDSSTSESSDSDSDSDSDHKIKELKNRIRERRKSAESEQSGGQSSKRTRPVRNRKKKLIEVESEQSDTDGDFIIKEEILEKAPVKKQTESIDTPKKVKPKAEKVEPKVKGTEFVAPANEDVEVVEKVKPKVKKTPVKKSLSKVLPASKKADTDPSIDNLVAFSESEVEFMVSLKEKYDMLLKDEDDISVSSITSEELNAAIPPSRTVVIDAGPEPEETLRIMSQFGGNPRLFTPVPEWLHPYLIGAKVKLEDVGMPTQEEIMDYLQKKQTKSKKRGAGWDIVVEWVPTAPPPAKKSKLEKELGFDVDSSFGQTVALSGGKRTRRANRKYSESEYSGEEATSFKTAQEQSNVLTAEVPTTDTMEQDQPNPPPPTQPSTTVRTHLGSSQTPKRGGRGRKDSLAVRRVEPSKDAHMVIEASNVVQSDKVKDIPVNPEIVEEKTEIIKTGEDTPAKVIHEDIVQHEDTSPGKKRRSKDIIAAYLTSAGVERGEEKHDIVEPVEKHDIVDDVKKNFQNQVDTSCESVIAVTNISDDKESVVAMLDAEISAADEELNSVLKNLKRKRSGSGDSKFHGWEVQSTAMPRRTGYSIMLDAPTAADMVQLETVGASFGMTDIDFLMSSDDSMCLLEVVMSQPMLRDVKKAECTSVMGLVGVKPIEVVENDGIKGKQSDSDNDERGAHSQSCWGYELLFHHCLNQIACL